MATEIIHTYIQGDTERTDDSTSFSVRKRELIGDQRPPNDLLGGQRPPHDPWGGLWPPKRSLGGLWPPKSSFFLTEKEVESPVLSESPCI